MVMSFNDSHLMHPKELQQLNSLPHTEICVCELEKGETLQQLRLQPRQNL